MPTSYTEGKYAGEYIASEANGELSRDVYTLTQQAAILVAGTVLGIITASGKVTPVNPGEADGSQTAAKILYSNVDATAGDKLVTVTSRETEVNGAEITYPAGATPAQILAISAQLAANTIIVRVGSV